MREFHADLAEVFDAAAPVLILCPEEARPAPDLERFLPAPLALARIDREIVLQLLLALHADDPDALRAALPSDRALAGVSHVALKSALRAPSPVDAARRLAGFLMPPASGGPTLDAIAGDGPAVTAPRRLVDDLGRWRL